MSFASVYDNVFCTLALLDLTSQQVNFNEFQAIIRTEINSLGSP